MSIAPHRYRLASVCLCLIFGAISPPAGGTEPARPRALPAAELDALLGQLERSLEPVRTMTMDFDQEKHLSLFSDVVKSHGVCLFVRPDTVRFEITEPFQSVLIARQRAVAKYEKLHDGWHKLDLGSPDMVLAVTAQIALWLEGKFRAQKDVYEISAVATDHLTIILTPKSDEMRKRIQCVELDLSADRVHVVRVTIREAEGDFTQIDFRNERRDVEVPAGLFETSGAAPASLPATAPTVK